MPKAASTSHLALALNTMLEREFVSPLTSIRGALEILRDFSDLSSEDRERFISNALQDCARLELGVEQLASTVYTSVDDTEQVPSDSEPDEKDSVYSERIRFFEEEQVVGNCAIGRNEGTIQKFVSQCHQVIMCQSGSNGFSMFFCVWKE